MSLVFSVSHNILCMIFSFKINFIFSQGLICATFDTIDWIFESIMQTYWKTYFSLMRKMWFCCKILAYLFYPFLTLLIFLFLGSNFLVLNIIHSEGTNYSSGTEDTVVKIRTGYGLAAVFRNREGYLFQCSFQGTLRHLSIWIPVYVIIQ